MFVACDNKGMPCHSRDSLGRGFSGWCWCWCIHLYHGLVQPLNGVIRTCHYMSQCPSTSGCPQLLRSAQATFLQLAAGRGLKLYWVLEQPSSSWMFQMSFMIRLVATFSAIRVGTWSLDKGSFWLTRVASGLSASFACKADASGLLCSDVLWDVSAK